MAPIISTIDAYQNQSAPQAGYKKFPKPRPADSKKGTIRNKNKSRYEPYVPKPVQQVDSIAVYVPTPLRLCRNQSLPPISICDERYEPNFTGPADIPLIYKPTSSKCKREEDERFLRNEHRLPPMISAYKYHVTGVSESQRILDPRLNGTKWERFRLRDECIVVPAK